MFKYYALALFFFSSSLVLYSQEFSYDFEVETTVYTPLTQAGNLIAGDPWIDMVAQLPIGFDFVLFGDTINTIYLTGFYYPAISGNITMSPVIMPYGADISDRAIFSSGNSVSPILYKYEGTAPSRVFKMEWQNAGFPSAMVHGGTNDSFVNFQLWLEEGSNIITFCYGPSEIINDDDFFRGAEGPAIGLVENFDIFTRDFENFWYLLGDANSPEPTLMAEGGEIIEFPNTLDSSPLPNTTYRFTPANISSIERKLTDNDLRVFPNPVTERLQLELNLPEGTEELALRLFNALGEEVYYRDVDQTFYDDLIIDFRELPAGVYHIQLSAGKKQISKTFVKA